jgi:SAM-dependent methyltransferase
MRNPALKAPNASFHGFGFSRLYSYANFLRFYRQNCESFALNDYRNVFAPTKSIVERFSSAPIRDARILDVGCGQRFPVALLFHSLGARVTGIDTEVVFQRPRLGIVLVMMRKKNWKRYFTAFVEKVLFDRLYYDAIRAEAAVPLEFRGLDIRCMSVCEMDFPDNHFDFVCSNSAFEHIDDPVKAAEGVCRVTKPGGLASIGVHLFPSISGGHHPEWQFPETNPSRTVPPWDHLRQRLFPTRIHLNRWREQDFLREFRKHFIILETSFGYEGRDLLSTEIRRELPHYAEDDLLKRSVRFVCLKPV